MEIVLIVLVLVAAGFVLFSLVRGLVFFSQSHQAAQEGRLEENQAMQNKMMFNRVKWQAVTVLLLIVIGFVAAGR